MKIFISDLDGTLIPETFAASKEALECINEVIESGNEMVIATGRTRNGIKLSGIDKPIYKIVMNGALIIDKKGNIIFQNTIDESIVEKLYNKFKLANIEFVTAEKSYFTISKEKYLDEYSKWDVWSRKTEKKGALEGLLANYVFDSKLEDFKDKVLKINILELNEEKRKQNIKYVNSVKELINTPFDYRVLELNNRSISKYSAISYLQKLEGWKDGEMYAFGDGENDCEMLKNIKNSYAPSNASLKAKKSAKYIIGPCEDNSVVKTIKSLIDTEKAVF
ncbi:MAG: HAD-IIB family hydrolase [Erysipelotrichaceae bacterium]|nr:HAD-IIB family hydrolase [Erysipelotrichaceae bacterium]